MRHSLALAALCIVTTCLTVSAKDAGPSNEALLLLDIPDLTSTHAAEVTLANLELRLVSESDATDRTKERRTEKTEKDLKGLQEDYDKAIKRELEDVQKDIVKLEDKIEKVDKKLEKASGENLVKYADARTELKAEKDALVEFKTIIERYKKYGAAVDGALPESLIERKAPDFKLSPPNGEEATLAVLGDKTFGILVFFSADNADSVTNFKALVGQMKNQKDVAIYGIDVGHTAEEWTTAAKGLSGLPVLLDTQRTVAGSYHVGFVPHVVLIDADRDVAAVFVGSSSAARRGLGTAITSLRKAQGKGD